MDALIASQFPSPNALKVWFIYRASASISLFTAVVASTSVLFVTASYFTRRSLMKLELGSGSTLQPSYLGLIMMIMILMVTVLSVNTLRATWGQILIKAFHILFWALIGDSPSGGRHCSLSLKHLYPVNIYKGSLHSSSLPGSLL